MDYQRPSDARARTMYVIESATDKLTVETYKYFKDIEKENL